MAAEINNTIKDLFDTVYDQISLSVSHKTLSAESFQTILLKVVDSVEKFSNEQPQKLSGTEKRAIALNLTHLIIDKLHQTGQINDEMYGWMSLGITFLAPVLFDGIKLAWKKLQEVVVDIEEHGTAGCCRRNFSNSKNRSRK